MGGLKEEIASSILFFPSIPSTQNQMQYKSTVMPSQLKTGHGLIFIQLVNSLPY